MADEVILERTTTERTISERIVTEKVLSQQTDSLPQRAVVAGGIVAGISDRSSNGTSLTTLDDQRTRNSGLFPRFSAIQGSTDGFELNFPDLPDKDAVRSRRLMDPIGSFSRDLAKVMFRAQVYLNDEHGASDLKEHWFPDLSPVSPVTEIFTYPSVLSDSDTPFIEVMKKRACVGMRMPVVSAETTLQRLGELSPAQLIDLLSTFSVPEEDGLDLRAMATDRSPFRADVLVDRVAQDGRVDLAIRPDQGLVTLHHHVPYPPSVTRFLLYLTSISPDFLISVLNTQAERNPESIQIHVPPSTARIEEPVSFALPATVASLKTGEPAIDLNAYRFILQLFGETGIDSNGKVTYLNNLQDVRPQTTPSCAVSYGRLARIGGKLVVVMETTYCTNWASITTVQ